MNTVDVLIIGAGPTGLTLACSLLEHGVSVKVVDKAAEPATTSRALILNARGVEVLDRLNALGDLPDRALPAIKTDFHFGNRVLTIRIGEVKGSARTALVISQAEIERELRRRLRTLGGHIDWGTELTDAIEDGQEVVATLHNGQTVRAKWLVGSDGAHSKVRKIANIGFPGVKIAERFLLADISADWNADRTGTAAWFTSEGALLAFPLRDVGGSDHMWRLVADIPLQEEEELGEQDIINEFRRLIPKRTGLTNVKLNHATWTSTFRIHRRLADGYRRGRMLLAGDSAHIHSLIGGQGMNTGIGDAENLAWKLALTVRGKAQEALLDTYEAERRPVATEVLRGTTGATRLLLSDHPLVKAFRNGLIVPLLERPWIQNRITAAGTQLGISYRGGPLAPRSFKGKGKIPRPGDRVTDLPCQHLNGSRTRLYAELGKRWVLLGPAAGEASPYITAAKKRLGEFVIALTHVEPGETEWWLVRPDAHLAWCGGLKSIEQLEWWLECTLVHGRVRR